MALKRNQLIISGIVICLILFGAIVVTNLTVEKSEKYYKVKKGKFEAVLNCKGEINGLKATPINTPKILGDDDLRIWQLKIVDLAQDGKYVKKGDFIVQLDVNTIMSRMREEQQKLEKEMAELNNAKIDSAVTLTEMREEIKNAKLDLEYNKIDLEQSIYESAAYQRKSKITYQKAENNIAKKQRDYLLEQNKLKLKVGRSSANVEKSQSKIKKYQQAMQAARITAPEDGIVIFGNSMEGKKLTKDATVLAFESAPPIATLPDMSKVTSETYVKEIDISKIKVGDKVRVTFDALEGIVINGEIYSIASIGEDHKDFDMKVFKVIIHLDETHEGLKPAMSSNNDIILAEYDEALFIPLDAVFQENGMEYIYLKSKEGIKKQVVKTGFENDEFVLIESGIEEGDRVLLEMPEETYVLADK